MHYFGRFREIEDTATQYVVGRKTLRVSQNPQLIVGLCCQFGYYAELIVMRSALVARPVNLLCCRLFTPHKSTRLEGGDQFVGCLETS
jgi:hypothetical protein